ncbi:hypothetical protein Tco_0129040 [Tanacetum coccineum]
MVSSSNQEHVQQKEDGIFISQDKYVAKILKKFNYSDVKSASTPVDLEKPLVKDGDADDVDVHLYRSMIGSLMYLPASKPDYHVCRILQSELGSILIGQSLSNLQERNLQTEVNMWAAAVAVTSTLDSNQLLIMGTIS